MSDDIVFELLHSEIINYSLEQNKSQNDKEVDLSVVEYIGFAAGYKIMERLTREWPRFKDELDTMKFICTDFWTCIYKKQIDNLRTNHQGVYVLQDNAFRFLTNFSNGQQYLEYAPRYVAYTCGLIRGGLANLCINSIVTAEVQSMPSCKFHIHVQSFQLQPNCLVCQYNIKYTNGINDHVPVGFITCRYCILKPSKQLRHWSMLLVRRVKERLQY